MLALLIKTSFNRLDLGGRWEYVTRTSHIMYLICAPTFCITFVFHFSWVLQPSQEKLKTCKVFFGGGGGAGGRMGGKQGALWEICKCSPIFSSSHTFSITCSRSLFVSPCPPECYFQSETKIEPDLRLGEWLEYSKMPPNHFAGLVCACLLANVNHSRVFE